MEKAIKRKGGFDIKDFFSKSFPIIGLAAEIIFFAIVTEGNLLTSKNIIRMLSQSLPMLIGTMGATFVFAQNILDMSMGSALGFAAMCAAYASHGSPWLAFPAALLAGLFVGAINGTLHGVLKINPLIATMAMSFIIRGMLQPLCNYGSVGLNTALLPLNKNWLKFTLVGIVFVAAYIIFEYTKLGKQCKVVGASEIAATQSGINVRRIKITGYLITGFAAGLAGFLTVLRSGTTLPATGNLFEFDVVIALVLGGMPITGGAQSRFHSAVTGTFILTVLSNGMTMWGIEEYPQQITKGLVFLVVLIISFAFNKKRAH